MTRTLGLGLDVAKRSGKPVPPAAYGAYLERLAKSIGLDKHGVAALTGDNANTVYRNFSGRPERSMLSMNKIREALIAKNLPVDPVPTENDNWIDPAERPAERRPSRLTDKEEIFRHNLVQFGEDAGYLDLHERAKATGIPLEILRSYELGNAQVSGSHLLELARVYGRDPNHFELAEPPPRDRKPPPAVHARVVGSIDDMAPENRARFLELQREMERINAAERERNEAAAAKKSPKKR